LADVLSFIWRQPSSRHLAMATILTLTLSLGLHPWYAAFMIRSHGMGLADLGLALGLIFGIGGVVGVWLGGYIAGRCLAGNECGQVRLNAVMIALLVPAYALFLLLPDSKQALFVLAPLVAMFSFFVGPTFTLMQRLVPDEMRATTLALVMLLANLIGMGIGSLVVGVLSDILQPTLGKDSLRYAMLAMSLTALWAAYHFWRAGSTVHEDLANFRYIGQRDTKRGGRLTAAEPSKRIGSVE
jgi:predicted MFS family arabinose efflux permease